MSRMVQVAVARDVTEGEELQTILETAGIVVELEPAVDHHPAATDDTPLHVLVPEASLEAARSAIEALTADPEDPLAE